MKRILFTTLGLLALSGCRKTSSGAQAAGDSPTGRASGGLGPDSPPASTGAGFDSLMALRKLPPSEESVTRMRHDVATLDDNDLHRLLTALSDTRHSNGDRTLFTFALGELAKRDPESALSWFDPAKLEANEPGFTSVADALVHSDPHRLETWLLNDLQKAGEPARSACMEMGLMYFAIVDPAFAMEFSPKTGFRNNDVINAVMAEYGRKSPQEAEASAVAHYKGSDLDYSRYLICASTDPFNPQLALEIASRISDVSMRGTAVSAKLAGWMDIDPDAAVKKLHELDPKDLQACLMNRPEASGSFVEQLSRKDPELLTGLMASVVPSASTRDLFQAAVQALTLSDPAHASALTNSLPDGPMKDQVLASQFQTLADVDPSAALAQASQLPEGNSRSAAYEKIGAIVSTQGLEETLKAAQGLAPADRPAFVAAALPAITGQDPREGAEFYAAAGSSLDASVRPEILTKIGDGLSRSDSSYAREWLGKLPQIDQPAAMRGVAREMARTDLGSLASLLDTLPKDKNWEAAARVMVESTRDSDTRKSQKWQQALTDAGYP